MNAGQLARRIAPLTRVIFDELDREFEARIRQKTTWTTSEVRLEFQRAQYQALKHGQEFLNQVEVEEEADLDNTQV